MKLTEMLAEIATLVAERDTINHGSIRCLYSENAVSAIMSAEDCDEVETGTVGDDDLADQINDIIENPERLIEADASDLAEALRELDRAYFGGDISNYLESEEEDELGRLDSLIEAAEKFVAVI